MLNNSAPVVQEKLLPHEGVSLADQQQKARQVLARRYDLQRTAAGLLRHRRALQGCHRWVAFGKDEVRLLSYPTLKKGKIKGLQSCSSPHICPVCAPKIAERRVHFDLTPGLARARALGLGILVLTSTIRHQAKDDFDANLAALLFAREASRSGGRWTRLRKKYGILGSIRAFECTYGVNGFHPHFHDLYFFERPLTLAELAAFEQEMAAIWSYAVEQAGLALVTAAHGLHVSDAHAKIEEYIQKQLLTGTEMKDVKRPQWDLPQEMGKQPVKKGRSQYVAGERVKGYSMMELLGIASDGELVDGAPTPAKAAHLFRQFDAAITKRRVPQLRWSNGLKKRLGVDDLTDEQIEALDAEDKEAEDFGSMAPAEISALVTDGKLPELTSALAENDYDRTQWIIAPYQRALSTSRCKVDAETGQVHLYEVPAFDASAPGLSRPRLRLDDPFADDRDRLPVVGRYVDPLCARYNIPASTALALREMKAAGDSVYSLDEDAALLRARAAEVQAWRSSWAVSCHNLPAAVLLRLLCLIAVEFERGQAPPEQVWQGWGPSRFTVFVSKEAFNA